MTGKNNNTIAEQHLSELKEKINFIDALSQEGFSQIQTLASLAMVQIKSGVDHYHQLENLYQALNIIKSKANEVENCINSEAEDVGCHYKAERLIHHKEVVKENVNG